MSGKSRKFYCSLLLMLFMLFIYVEIFYPYSATTNMDINIMKGQLSLLHTQLLYERQKRELHAERNRRLLSKIARAEKYREENSILVSPSLLICFGYVCIHVHGSLQKTRTL